jgi:hypothetical protein
MDCEIVVFGHSSQQRGSTLLQFHYHAQNKSTLMSIVAILSVMDDAPRMVF